MWILRYICIKKQTQSARSPFTKQPVGFRYIWNRIAFSAQQQICETCYSNSDTAVEVELLLEWIIRFELENFLRMTQMYYSNKVAGQCLPYLQFLEDFNGNFLLSNTNSIQNKPKFWYENLSNLFSQKLAVSNLTHQRYFIWKRWSTLVIMLHAVRKCIAIYCKYTLCSNKSNETKKLILLYSKISWIDLYMWAFPLKLELKRFELFQCM